MTDAAGRSSPSGPQARPLVRHVFEQRLLGGAQVVIGLGVSAVEIVERPVGGSVSLLLITTVFGLVIYATSSRPQAQALTASALEVEEPSREPTATTVRRVFLVALGQAVLFVALVSGEVLAFDELSAASVGGIVVASGLAVLFVTRRLTAWQDAYRVEILRESRWYWTGWSMRPVAFVRSDGEGAGAGPKAVDGD